ncbi:MAG: hypothetical protein S4CHLAM37_04020 [Chlamydiia bacterium]|nr:hypothetical protein [Chlamydiia bacterium]
MYISLIAVFLFAGSLLVSSEQSTAANKQKRVKDHLLLKDYNSALDEISTSIVEFPDSADLKALKVRVLSESGRDLDAFRDWKKIAKDDEKFKEDLALLEIISWSVLEKAEHSNQQVVNISSMIGASLTQDARAVSILMNNLNSTNAYLRMIAVRLSTQFGDKILIDTIKSMLKKENVWYVRLEVIKALSRFQIKEIGPLLKDIVSSDRSTIEERYIAAEALLNLHETLDENELVHLYESKRAGLRYLACEVVSFLNLNGHNEHIAKLLDDPNADVRIVALNTLIVTGIKDAKELTQEKLLHLLEDPNPYVAMTACGVLMYYDPSRAKSELTDWVFHKNPDYRRFAASVISQSGEEGIVLGNVLLKSTSDPFVKVNLAYGLLGHTQDKMECCKYIAEFLHTHKQKIMMDPSNNPYYKVISPSFVRHTPEVIQYPVMVDQQMRLHLLNKLAMFRFPEVSSLVKAYLKSESFGMTFAASTVLLEEGTDESIEIIRELLDDKDEKTRVQAALVLALFGTDKRALATLQNAYPKMDRDFKMHILDALGHLGSKEAIPFLVELLDDPFNMMRIIAASAIIRCIYH